MGYILQYFEEVIEIYTEDYYRGNKAYLQNGDRTEEICEKASLIEKELREIYYNPKLSDTDNLFFYKILKRLKHLSLIVEENIDSVKKTYIIDNREFLLNEYINYHSIHTQLCVLIRMIVKEFEKGELEIIPVCLFKKTNEALHEDYKSIRESLANNKPPSIEIINYYKLDDISIQTIKEGEYISQENIIRHKIRRIQQKSQLSLKELTLMYIRNYEQSGKPEHRFFYKEKREKLIHDISTIKLDVDKMTYVENFFLHTCLCPDLVLYYFNNVIQQIIKDDEKDIHEYFGQLKRRLGEIQEKPKFKVDHIRVLENSYENTVSSLRELIEETLNDIDYTVEQDAIPKNENKKITLNINKKEFGILIDLFLEQKMFFKNKRNTVELISKVVTFRDTGDITVDDLYNKTYGWDKEDKETENVCNMLQKMVKTTITKKINKKK